MKHVRCHAALGALSPPRALIHIPDALRLSLLPSPFAFFAFLMGKDFFSPPVPPKKNPFTHQMPADKMFFPFFSPSNKADFSPRSKANERHRPIGFGVCASSERHQAPFVPQMRRKL